MDTVLALGMDNGHAEGFHVPRYAPRDTREVDYAALVEWGSAGEIFYDEAA